MADPFAEIRALLADIENQTATAGTSNETEEIPGLEPNYFDSEVAFLDGAASLVARYGARLGDRGNVLTVRFLLGDLAWAIEWLLDACALDDVDGWEAAAAWFEARALDAPDPVTMVLPEKTGDVLAFVAALERIAWLGREMVKAEKADRDGAGLTGTEAIKVVEKVVRHQLGARLTSLVFFDGAKVGHPETWPVIVALADYLRAQYQKLGEATHAGSLGQPGTPSGDPPPYSTPK
ncbi:MAG TPA: hypothetical protein PLN64_00980 [Candidatus Bipolaricaulis anaerobius]|nr:hypothetical protein [Candidatus Bipolaricaulis anaerobius]